MPRLCLAEHIFEWITSTRCASWSACASWAGNNFILDVPTLSPHFPSLRRFPGNVGLGKPRTPAPMTSAGPSYTPVTTRTVLQPTTVTALPLQRTTVMQRPGTLQYIQQPAVHSVQYLQQPPHTITQQILRDVREPTSFIPKDTVLVGNRVDQVTGLTYSRSNGQQVCSKRILKFVKPCQVSKRFSDGYVMCCINVFMFLPKICFDLPLYFDLYLYFYPQQKVSEIKHQVVSAREHDSYQSKRVFHVV
jgi:hypothetical protein